jgi:hypothetical protein
MKGRTTTPLELYVERATDSLFGITFWSLSAIVGIVALIIAVREPIGAALTLLSSVVCTLILFSLLETFPSLIVPLGLDRTPYYAWKSCCLPDEVLIWRQRPFLHSTVRSFRGYLYSPLFGVDVAPLTVETRLDKDGFAHNSASPSFPDVAIIGDSFVADGVDERDSFGRRFEALSGLTVANLGVSGYGPFQYLEVLKRYGLSKKPKYAMFVFYAGNDIDNTHGYLDWRQTHSYGNVSLLYGSVYERFFAALSGIRYFNSQIRKNLTGAILASVSHEVPHSARPIHPNLAVVRLGNQTLKMLLVPENKVASTEALLSSSEWQAMKAILSEFKMQCLANRVVPIVVYVPTITSIYAEYATSESGEYWLRFRSDQIARKSITQRAMISLADELGIKLIDLTIPFEAAAASGKLLYQRFDTHWNSEGKAVAAEYVAKNLNKLTY